MKLASDILFIVSVAAAVLGLSVTIYLLISKKVNSSRLSRMRIENESSALGGGSESQPPKFAFDWKYDDFDRSFNARFVIPTIAGFALCVVAVVSAILGMILG